jgi:hypothetical protein
MKEALTKQLKCLNTIILDNKTHSELNKEKDEILRDQIDADVDIGMRFGDTERKIRLSKLNKNQTERMKIQTMVQTCRERNQV